MYGNIIGKLLEDKYRVEEQIGMGGFSCVYRIMDEHIQTRFAMKVIPLKDKQKEYIQNTGEETPQMMKEVCMLQKLNHKGLPLLHDVFLYESQICIVMELIRGETLDDYITKNGKMSEHEVWEIGKQLAEILRYLHQQSVPVIYADLKPGNIILYNGHIRLVDLGGAFQQFGDEKCFYATRGYAAPELERGESSTRCDIYSFGRIMIFLLTGRHPFLFGEERMNKVLKRYGVSGTMRKLTETCISVEPGKRFRSGYELLDCFCRKKGKMKRFYKNVFWSGYRNRILECECSLFVSQGL